MLWSSFREVRCKELMVFLFFPLFLFLLIIFSLGITWIDLVNLSILLWTFLVSIEKMKLQEKLVSDMNSEGSPQNFIQTFSVIFLSYGSKSGGPHSDFIVHSYCPSVKCQRMFGVQCLSESCFIVHCICCYSKAWACSVREIENLVLLMMRTRGDWPRYCYIWSLCVQPRKQTNVTS